VPLIPEWSVPNMLESVAVPAAIWKKPEDMEACLQDSWETTPEVSVLLLLSRALCQLQYDAIALDCIC
jgi:hypothetical protein